MTTTPRTELAVIGGGAAGMLAAATAAERGLSVCLIERNDRLGWKLSLTGKGRCNVTNDCEKEDFLKNVTHNHKFLYSAINALTPSGVMELFEEHGLSLKTERGGRVFPVSDRAQDVVRTLEKMLEIYGVRIIKARAKNLCTRDGEICAVATDEGEIACDAVILCTGGKSYPRTGSTGDGLRMATALGHNIHKPRPSLVPLESDAEYCGEMQGFSLKNVCLSAYNGKNEKIFSDQGEMLFTHFGVSGPLVLSASAHMRDFENDSYRLSIDLKPALDEQKLDARILRDFEKYKNRSFINSLGDLAGRSMIPVIVELSGIPAETPVHSITREQRHTLVRLFKDFPVPVTGTRPIDEAIITSGGVDVKEVNPRTMESRLVRGVYFAGEILDVDAYTGGYNLQIAWSTAYVAGKNVLAQI